jgi:hypothetical protein
VGLAVLLREIEDLGKRPPVQIVFKFGRAVLGVGRRVRSLPVLVVVGLPFPFEILLPAAPCPELRFFQVYGLCACVEGSLDPQGEILSVILTGRNIGYVAAAAVQDQLAVGLRLGLIPVIRPSNRLLR